MDANTITTLIGGLGFPIVMCLLQYYDKLKFQDKLTEALNNNTVAITKLVEKLEGENE